LALLAGAMTFAILAVLAIAARARATETIYWDNYRDAPATIGSAEITGSGGGLLNLAGVKFDGTEGMAYDPVTNRLFVAAEAEEATPVLEEGAIVAINLDGSGAGYFSAPGLSVKSPEGIALDPATRTMYWVNTDDDTIGWAKLDGSAAGTLNTAGAATESYGYRLALDPASGRVYWGASSGGNPGISWANVNNTGAGILPAEIKETPDGLATNPLTNRLYILTGGTSGGTLSSVGLDGGTVESVPLTNPTFSAGYGLAIDPITGIAYWGNYGYTKLQTNAIGFASLSGASPGSISPTTTPVNGAQDPVIVRSPAGTGAPQITQAKAALSCSLGSWAPDYPGAFLYQGPTSYSYQWLLNGQPIPGATAATFTATAAGSYSCAVTGKNPSGAATQASAVAATVTPAGLSVSLKTKKAKAKAGKTATVKFNVANAGDISSVPVKVCAKLTKKAKKGLVAPKCATLAPVVSGGSAVATLKVKTKKTAKGAYKFTTQVKGASAKSVTVSVKVIGAKKPHKKKH
jgi:DNA-binding beta-propeller fold protein YncE